MNEIFFSVIIPNYNNSTYLEKCLKSVLNQTFTNYELIVIDDVSTDNSVEIIKNIFNQYQNKNTKLIELKEKAWNGGSRNIGIKEAKGKYFLFLDSDDWFLNENIFQQIYNFIISKDNPELIRLSFDILTKENWQFTVWLSEKDLDELANTCYVACWIKCVRADKMIPFEEDTLMEDAIQHIKQVDVLNNFEVLKLSAVCHNTQNPNQCSSQENKKLQNAKWEKSMKKFYQSLLDLKCNHDYCEKRRLWKIEEAKGNIERGEAWQ